MASILKPLTELLITHPVISVIWADYKGIKAVFQMDQPKDSKKMPSGTLVPEVTFKLLSQDKTKTFILNCYASTIGQAEEISETIIDELDDRSHTVDGVTFSTRCSGLVSFGDSTTKEYNSPLEIRVIYGG